MSTASRRSRCARVSDLVLRGLALGAILLALVAVPAQAAVTSEITMVLSKISGTVEVSTAASPDWQPATEGLTLRPEDKIRTAADSTARVSYPDAELRITPESTAILGYTSVRMQVGTLWVRMRKSGRAFEVLTPTVAVTIRGTLVRTATGPGGATVHLLEGVIDVKADGRTEQVNPHQQVEATATGGFTIGRIDSATEVKLRSEFNVGKGEGGRPAVPLPAPKGKGSGGSGAGGSGSGGSGSGGSGGSGSKGGTDRSSSANDIGQRALAAGLQNLERDLDARSTGLGVSGGSEAAFDGSAAARGSAATGAGTSGGSAGGGASSSAAVRSLVSRPGGVAPIVSSGLGGGLGGVGGDLGSVGGGDPGGVVGGGAVGGGAVGGGNVGGGGGAGGGAGGDPGAGVGGNVGGGAGGGVGGAGDLDDGGGRGRGRGRGRGNGNGNAFGRGGRP